MLAFNHPKGSEFPVLRPSYVGNSTHQTDLTVPGPRLQGEANECLTLEKTVSAMDRYR